MQQARPIGSGKKPETREPPMTATAQSASAKTTQPGRSLSRILLAEIPQARPSSRLQYLDAARGFAILLVVIGHVVARDMPLGNEWYAFLKEVIYRFHMPLFMVLTGMSFALSLPVFRSWGEVGAYSAKRSQRLLVAYMVFGIVVLAGKMAAAHFMHVDNPARGNVNDVMNLLLVPGTSVAGFLWFIYVLCFYMLTVPALFYVIGRRPVLLLLAGIAVHFAVWPQFFMLDEVMYYLPFFAGGMVLWIWRDAWERLSSTTIWLLTAVFLLVLFIFEVPKSVVGAASVLPIIGAMQRLPAQWQDWLAWVGRNSLVIYLINTIAIGLTKGVLLLFMPWDGVNFLLYFPVLTIAGVGLPLLVKHVAVRWTPPVARYL
jgi:fucose 4-O-acetylase-like acetyltransferase